jgi:hypothetical protein
VTLIDTGAVAYLLGTTPNAVRITATRYPGLLPRRGTDAKGRTLYALADVEALAGALRECAA